MRCSSASAILLALALAACTRTTTRAWLPSPSNPRFAPEAGSRTLGTYLAVECERLRGTPRASGDALLRASVDGAGMVTRAEIERGSGD